MASLLVLVAHSGRTLQLDVQPSTRVDAVQHALVSFTGIPVADQIAMYQGARLDQSKLLGAYRLPVDPSVAQAEDHPVFLYCRSYLKPGAALPPPEALAPLQVQVPPLAEVNLAHPLHSAPSPLVRALPDYERHFQHHLATTRAYWEVAQARLQRCRQLLSEQEVQARAADAARANVEAHYTYILNSYQSFLVKYNAQHAAHAQLLASFPSDLAALEAIELHPSLQQHHHHASTSQPPSSQQQETSPSHHPPHPSTQHPSSRHPHPHQQPLLVTQQAPYPSSAQDPHLPGGPPAAPTSDLGQHQLSQQRGPLQQPQPQQQQQPHGQNAHPGQQPLAVGAAGQGAAVAAAGPSAGSPPGGPIRLRLADLYPMGRLREWAETCGRSHASFGAKVSELEGLFQLLRRDVEGLFMQAPSVDLDALGRQMSEHEALLDEHSSLVQVLSKDLRTVRTLVEDVVRQLGSSAAGGGGGGLGGGAPGGGGTGMRSGALHDAAAAMEAIHETHRNRVLPRLAALDSQLSSFAAAVESSKVAMSRDVLSQLQRISGQQSRIRDMKNKLAAFHEVLGRQDAAFGELRVVHRLPAAYRALLAEVVRRSAWHQLYCGQAGRLAEHMARFREKEAARRTAFSSQVSRYLPPDLLARAGLVTEPPHCQVTVPSPAVPLISVAMADLQRLSYLDERILASSTSAAALRASCAAAATVSGTAVPPAGLAIATAAGGVGARVSLHTPAGATTAAAAMGSHNVGPLPSGGGGAGGVLEPGLSSGVGGVAGAHAPIAASISQHHHHNPHHHHHHHHPSHHHHHHHQQQALLQQSAAGSRMGVSTSLPFPGTMAVLDADPAPPADSVHALEMENARLRAELANHIAAACIRELTATATTTTGTTTSGGEATQQQQQQQQPAGESSASPAPTTAAATTSRASGGGAAGTASAATPPASGAGSSPSPAAAGVTGSGCGSTAARRDPAELVTAMQRALGMKDDLIRQQAREVSALAARAAAYEERITALEALLSRQAIGTEGESEVVGCVVVGDGRDGSIGGRGRDEGSIAGTAAVSGSGSDHVALGVSGSGVGVGSSMVSVSVDGGLGTQSASSGVGSGSAMSKGLITDQLLEEEDRAGVPDDTGAWQLGGGGAAGGPTGRRRGDTGGDRSGSPVLEATATLGQVIRMAASEGVALAEGAAAAEIPARTSGAAAGGLSSPFSILAGQAQEGAPVGAPEEVQREHLPLSLATQKQGQGAAIGGSGRRRSGALGRAVSAVRATSSGGGGSGSFEHCRPQLLAASAGAPASLRGSSGPQAIPQASGQGRRGGGGGDGGGSTKSGAVDCTSGSPYEPRVPMSIGSLPFATSLPALSSSVMGGRLASSPSTGIGLGLALGFGLASLAEGQLLAHEGMQGSSARSSSSGSSSGNESIDGTESRITDSGTGDVDDSISALRRSNVRMATSTHGSMRDSRGVGIGSVIASDGGASSSSGLQFQPSWSAPVSGDNGFVHDNSSAAGEAVGPGGIEAVAMAVGIMQCGLGLAGMGGGERGGDGEDTRVAPIAVDIVIDDSSARGGPAGRGSAGGHVEQQDGVGSLAQAAKQQQEGCDASGTRGVEGGSGAGGGEVGKERGACSAEGGAAAPQCHGEMDEGGSSTQGEEGEVPDIDEVIDGDGAWEVTSGGVAAVEEADAEMLATVAATEEGEEESTCSSVVGAGAAPADAGNVDEGRPLALGSVGAGADMNTGRDLRGKGASGDGRSPEPTLPAYGFHPLEVSSGYESVGSMSSFGAAGEGL